MGETFIGNRVISRLIYFLEKFAIRSPFIPSPVDQNVV